MPGLIDPTQALRLLREVWPDPTMLAEELYAILTATARSPLSVPLTLARAGTQAPLELQGFKIGDSIISVKGPDGEPVGTFVLTDGGLQFVASGRGGGGTTTKAAGGSGSVAFAKVVSGSGDTYLMDVYTGGRSKLPSRKTVKQVSIDPAKKIAAGTWWSVVFEPDGVWSMQYPIFQ